MDDSTKASRELPVNEFRLDQLQQELNRANAKLSTRTGNEIRKVAEAEEARYARKVAADDVASIQAKLKLATEIFHAQRAREIGRGNEADGLEPFPVGTRVFDMVNNRQMEVTQVFDETTRVCSWPGDDGFLRTDKFPLGQLLAISGRAHGGTVAEWPIKRVMANHGALATASGGTTDAPRATLLSPAEVATAKAEAEQVLRADPPGVGDIVRLKSGGPLMNVFGKLENGHLCCEWDGDMDSPGKQDGDFHPDTVDVVSYAVRQIEDDDFAEQTAAKGAGAIRRFNDLTKEEMDAAVTDGKVTLAGEGEVIRWKLPSGEVIHGYPLARDMRLRHRHDLSDTDYAFAQPTGEFVTQDFVRYWTYRLPAGEIVLGEPVVTSDPNSPPSC